MALVPQVVDAVKVPVIAAGGIIGARGIVVAFALGAAAVQIGTAYLLCPETRIRIALSARWDHIVNNPDGRVLKRVFSSPSLPRCGKADDQYRRSLGECHRPPLTAIKSVGTLPRTSASPLVAEPDEAVPERMEMNSYSALRSLARELALVRAA